MTTITKGINVDEIASCIYSLNCHAKAALDPRELYALKRRAIEKLLDQGHAKKIGLHYPKERDKYDTIGYLHSTR